MEATSTPEGSQSNRKPPAVPWSSDPAFTGYEPPKPETATGKSGEPKQEKYRRRAADILDRAATKVREVAHDAPGGNRTTRWGYQAGSGMDRAATYLRDRSADEISRDAQNWVRQNPAPSIACAVAVGFFAGILLRRR